MLEGIICPVCENTIKEINLKDSLVCSICRTDLKNRRYLDFFDPKVYSEDVDDLDQTKEEEGDPSEFEKKKDHYNIYENEIIPKDKTDDNIKGYSQFDGLNEDWEDFNEREFDKI